jgi:predicted nucleic acid-binding Zn ribbon protein
MERKQVPEARKLGDLIKEFSRQENVSHKLMAYQVVGEWENIVGDSIAKNTEIVRVENGILYVKAATSAWRNELVFMKPAILEKIRKNYPDSGVEEIFFI